MFNFYLHLCVYACLLLYTTYVQVPETVGKGGLIPSAVTGVISGCKPPDASPGTEV